MPSKSTSGNPFQSVNMTNTKSKSSNPFANFGGLTKKTSTSSSAAAPVSFNAIVDKSSSAEKDSKGGKRDVLTDLLKFANEMSEMHPIQSWSVGLEKFISRTEIGDTKQTTPSTNGGNSKPGISKSPTSSIFPSASLKFTKDKKEDKANDVKDGAKAASNKAPFSNFTFGSPTSKVEPSSSAPSKPSSFTGFSFGSSTNSSTKDTSSKPAEFSFGKPVAPPVSAPALKEINNSENSEGFPLDEQIKVERAVNTEENIEFECRGKLYSLSNGEWKEGDAGNLCVMRHKTEDKKRIILRSELGQVRLNEAIGKSMNFDKNVNEKKGVGSVKFCGMGGIFLLKVKSNNIDKLHSTLEEMAK